MKEISTNKEVIKIDRHWSAREKLTTRSNFYWTHTLIDERAVDSEKLANYELPSVTELSEKAKLIFHKTSKFPRHKLEITTYQRKIKENLADYMVGNADKFNIVICRHTYRKAFITPDIIYITNDAAITYAMFKANFPAYKDNEIEYIEDYKLVNLTKENLLYLEYMEGKHTIPIISDESLNKLVDGNNEKLNAEVLDSIIELVKSGNKDNVVLGTKLFTQFNLSATPCLTRLFLMLYNEVIKQTDARNSVVYKNVLEQFGPVYIDSEFNIRRMLTTIPPVDREELALVRKLIQSRFDYVLENFINDKNETYKGLGLKIEYKIVECTE